MLEIGCGAGGNLIPLAYYLPGSSFVGIDLARTAIAAARRMARDLGLRNIELRAADLRTIGATDGKFDYIVAHGIYSWVPPEVRDRLLAICRARLARNGVAFVSYNALPGRRRLQALRERLLDAVGGIKDPAKRLAAARRFPETEGLPDDLVFHDLLAPVNDPVTFREFTAHAARHRLRYLGDADPHVMFDRRYRRRALLQTLLCREEVTLRRRVTPARMDRFLFSEKPYGQVIRGGEGVAQALHEAAPLPLPFAELIPYAGSKPALREILWALVRAGCADIHVHDFPCQETVTDKPCASLLARYQAARGEHVTNACHNVVAMDNATRRLLARLDGRHQVSDYVRVAWLAQMALLVAPT